MRKRIIQEIDFTPDREPNGKTDSNNRMPAIKCFCGCEILIIPDLKAMATAIKNHVDQHKKVMYGSERILSLDMLETFLTQQVLIKVNLETSKYRFIV
jgi:hypothetical protein